MANWLYVPDGRRCQCKLDFQFLSPLNPYLHAHSLLFSSDQFWRRRYYKAVGARLLAYHDTHLAPRAAIDLTQAIRLTSNGRLILGTPQSPDQRNHHEMSEEDCVKNSFQFTFSNGEKIDFFCDTERERDVWVNTMRAAIGSMPQWPEWLIDGKDDNVI